MDFLGGSVQIGRLFEINIRVHILYFVWMGYRLLTAGDEWGYALAFLAMLFAIVLMHEFGHCFGARAVGGNAENILMWPLGGLAYAHAPMTPWAQFVTVAAGPLVNVVFCVLAAGVLIATTGNWTVCSPNPFAGPGFAATPELWQWYLWVFYWVNLMLLCFNLLPIYPLDGGQLFMTAIWPFVGLHRATEIACKVGIGGAIFLAGMAIMHQTAFMLIMIAIFGAMTCWQRLQALKYGMVVDERVQNYRPARRSGGPGFWSRLFGRRTGPPRRARRSAADENPNPSGWEQQLSREQQLQAEVDRILAKVREHGVRSLSYTERQTLERATRELQERERQFDRDTRV